MRSFSKFLISLSFVIAFLSGCQNGNSEPEVNGRKDYPDFTATISSVETRAYDKSWEPEDKIGVTGVNRTNVCYLTKNGDGDFIVETSGKQIYFQDDSEVTFTAYYPWNNLSEQEKTISADTREQNGQGAFDFLWARASGKKDAPNVAFNFHHMMSKVSFTVKPGEAISYDELKTIRLSLAGFRPVGYFNIDDGTVTVGGDVCEDWMFTNFAQINESERNITFSFIFFPQVFASPMKFLAEQETSGNVQLSLKSDIDFTIANREMDGTDAKNEWVAGRQYNISLTLHKTEIRLDQCIINDWNQIKGDEITVD